MKRRGKKSKSMNMMGSEPFKQKAKKPEPDDKPTQHQRIGHKSTNKNMAKTKSARAKKLTGVML